MLSTSKPRACAASNGTHRPSSEQMPFLAPTQSLCPPSESQAVVCTCSFDVESFDAGTTVLRLQKLLYICCLNLLSLDWVCSCRDGNTALHVACQSNQLKVIEILLQWGARPNMQNASGFAPVRNVCNCTCSYNGDCIDACSDLVASAGKCFCIAHYPPLRVAPAKRSRLDPACMYRLPDTIADVCWRID